jgi:hypothetical protein
MVNKKRIFSTVLIGSLLLLTATVGASPMDEVSNEKALWNKADKIADASETQIPGAREISYNETDGKGNVLYSDQALVLIEGAGNNRYLTVREYGDSEIFNLMDRYTDGLVLSPFNDNVYDVDYSYTGVDETIQKRLTAVYTFSMAYDASLPFYDPNYQESDTILGWDSDDETFDGTITGTLWLDKITGAPVKMESVISLGDNTQSGTLNLSQTVFYSQEKSLILPTQIYTEGTLRTLAGEKGQISLTDFQMYEQQSNFWENQKIVKGETVNY